MHTAFFDISIIQEVSCQLREEMIMYLGVQDTLYSSKAKLKKKKQNQINHHSIHLPQRTKTKSPENKKEKSLSEF